MATAFGSFSLTQVFDPSCEFIFYWNRVQFAVGLIIFFLDPMFLYLPTVNSSPIVINMDLDLGATLAMLRMVGDFLQMLGIIIRFRTACEAPYSKVFRRKRLIEEPRAIAIKYLKSTFFIDLIAMLPLPQAYIWHQILASNHASAASTLGTSVYYNLFDVFLIQFPPRFFLLVNSKSEITRKAGIIMRSAMSGAFYNLFLFLNLSNFLGAMYYQFHINWLYDCMDTVQANGLEPRTLDWDQLLSNCTQDNGIEQGMFSSALTNKIGFFGPEFLHKLFHLGDDCQYCCHLTRSHFLGRFDNPDAGLLLLYIKAGIQSMEEREEQQRARHREIKEWMDYHQLPLNLKERVDLAIQSECTANGIDDEAMLDSLPLDISCEIRKYLYLDSVCKMPKFANMDPPLVEAICQHLKTFSAEGGTYIVYEGDIVKRMLFIFNGRLELSLTDRGNTSIAILQHGDCYGQELVTWASQPTTSMDNLPSSSWTVKCLTDVEAFVLQAYEMKILATRFAHNQDFQRAFKQHYP